MNSNTDSIPPSTGRPDGLAALSAAVDELASQDLNRLLDTVVAERVLRLRRLVDRLEGQWLKALATVDGGGAASGAVRTARALFRGPLAATAQALADGDITAAHARVLAQGTKDLPQHVAAEAEPVLLEAAGRLDPPRLRRVLGHLQLVADPDGAEHDNDRRHQRRGLWLAPTVEGMVALDGLLEAEAGQTLLAALEPLARPADASDARSGRQRRADALTELARRSLESGRLPQTGGVRPQLTVTVDLDSLLGRPGAVGGEVGGSGPLEPAGCRRLACDGAVTRVLVTRHPTHHHQQHLTGHPDSQHHPGHGWNADAGPVAPNPNRTEGLDERLRAAMALLPPILGGAPTQPLDVGRTSRVVQPAQRTALAVRDGGCVFPDCQRPLAWCEAHHLVHWLEGGPTDLANLALVCRTHHRAVHEGGWRLTRNPEGRLTASPPHRRHRRHGRHPTAA
jgi:hypothetical protein